MKYPKAYFCFQGSVWRDGNFEWTSSTSEVHEVAVRLAAEKLVVSKSKYYPNAEWVDVALWNDEEGCMNLPVRYELGREVRHFIVGRMS